MKQQPDNIFTNNIDEDPLFNIAFENAKKLFADGRLDEAQGACEAILLQYPDNVLIRYSLSIIYIDLENFIAAEECLEEALEIEPDNANIMSLLGMAKCGTLDLDNAAKLGKKAVSINPILENYSRYTYILRTSGNFEEAITQIYKTLELKKDYMPAYMGLTEMIKFTENTPELKHMLEMDKRPGKLSLEDRSILKFTLGKAFYDMEEYKKSFNYYKSANELRKKDKPPIKQYTKIFKQDINTIIDSFTTDTIKNLQNLGNPTNKPIFIIGMPRSGTTLIEQILSSHPDVDSAGEINEFMHASPIPTDIEGFKDKILGILLSKQFHEMGENYLNAIERISNNKHVINKLPFNYQWLGIIHLALPNAKIIHCARNPMDTGLSAYRQFFVNDIPWCNDLEMFGHIYSSYDDLMQHWYNLFPSYIYNAQYEEIVKNPEQHIKALIKFCGLEWNDDCLEFYKSKTNIRTASVYQVRQPVYKTSLKGWTKFEQELQPLYKIVKDRIPKED